jgi:hypothetical protein
MVKFSFGANVEWLLRTRQIFLAPQISPNNIEAQHFDVINCSSGGILFGGLTYISAIREAENLQCNKIDICLHCEH